MPGIFGNLKAFYNTYFSWIRTSSVTVAGMTVTDILEIVILSGIPCDDLDPCHQGLDSVEGNFDHGDFRCHGLSVSDGYHYFPDQ